MATDDKTEARSTGEAGRAAPVTVAADETEKGYRGIVPDQRPNEDYTVAGAIAGRSPSASEASAAALRSQAEAAYRSTQRSDGDALVRRGAANAEAKRRARGTDR